MLQASPVYEDYLSTLAKNHTLPVAGIVLGLTRSQHPDTIVHMCRLFKNEDDLAEDPVDEEERKNSLVYDVEDILHMLTPGIEVLGTFVVTKGTDDVVKDTDAWDRVKLIYRVIRKLCPDASKHYVLIHQLGEKGGKTTSKLVVGDKPNLDKNELKPVAIEFSAKDAQKLVQVNALYSLTRSHFLRSYDWKGGERGHLKAAKLKELLCDGLEKTLQDALITFNGEVQQEKKKILDVAQNQTEAGGDRSKLAPIVAEIYEKNVPFDDNEEVKRSSDLVQLKGCVASRLFFYPDDSLEFVEKLLRKDLIQSIRQRIDRATESVGEQVNEEEEPDNIVLEELSNRLGRRIYFTIQPSNIQLFDYLYPDESEDELRERINHKLDIDVEVTDIYFDLEEDGQGFGASGSYLQSGDQTDGSGQAGGKSNTVTGQIGNRKMMYLVIRFVLVALGAIIIPLVFYPKK